MGKIIKYCDSCEESFVQESGSCQTCGAKLQTFELSPVDAAPAELVDQRGVVHQALGDQVEDKGRVAQAAQRGGARPRGARYGRTISG